MSHTGHIPVIKSFFDPIALAEAIAAAYSLSNVRCQLIKATMRDVYRVVSGKGEFVALVYRADQTEAAIREEVALTDHLASQGFAGVTAVHQSNGDSLLSVHAPEGVRHVALIPFVPGTFTRRPTPDIIGRYGALLAEFHNLTTLLPDPQARPTYDAETLIRRSMEIIAAALQHMPPLVEELQQIAHRTLPQLRAVPQTEPAFGIVHGDVIPSNALISADKRLTLIDYDLFGMGWRTYDIAAYLNEVAFWKMGEAATATFLDGYTGVRPLNMDDLQTIPLMRIARHFFSLHTAARHVNTWGSAVYLSDAVLESAISSLRELSTEFNG